jgi:hypothetical protein
MRTLACSFAVVPSQLDLPHHLQILKEFPQDFVVTDEANLNADSILIRAPDED